MPATNPADTLNILEDLAKIAKKKGVADFMISHSDSEKQSVAIRNGAPEKIAGATMQSVVFQVFKGRRLGTATAVTSNPAELMRALEQAVENAKYASEDVSKTLAAPEQISHAKRDLQLNDPFTPDTEHLSNLATRTEAAAMQPGITNSSGATASWKRSVQSVLASNGIAVQETLSYHSVHASVIAGAGAGMKTSDAGDGRRWFENMMSPEEIGREAAAKTLAKLNSRPIATMTTAVIFDREAASGLLYAFLDAIDGHSLHYKQTYLRRKDLGKQLFSDKIQIIEDPFILRGDSSDMTDEAGLARHKMNLVENGALKTWLIGLQDSRKLRMAPTGHTGGVSNVFMAAGQKSKEDLIREMGSGLLITDMMGEDADVATGEYSAGAYGFWIEDGKIAFPVSGITIAGKLPAMFKSITPANDLDIWRAATPSLRVDGMKIGGL